MKKKKKSYLRQIYAYDETDKSYLIDLSLDKYEEIFNDWDAGPLKKKAMNPELETYLDETAYEIPLKHKIKIVFALPANVEDNQKESIIKDVFKNYYRAMNHFLTRDMKTSYRKMAIYIMLGFIFIVTSTLMDYLLDATILKDILSQGIFIGGWVLMWEAFSLFFFVLYDSRDKRKRYIRFINSKIIFRYIKK